MAILVCGGAGYIGSHMVSLLKDKGYEVLIADNLEKGHKEAVQGCKLLEGDLRNRVFVDQIFKEHKIDGVIDFAAYSLVGESVNKPLDYFDNNINTVINILRAMNEHGCKKIIFSSTAATYGNPEKTPIQENDKTIPTNPYGESKLAVEKLLKWSDGAYGIKHAVLRYFNAAGAHPSGEIGEDHSPETHLIPVILQVVNKQRETLSVFGNDYKTPDGTCVRDYIYVMDLCRAHLLAYEYLNKGGDSDTFNLGNGNGFSVMEVLETTERVVGEKIPFKMESRRAGDPDILVASSEKAKRILGWKLEEGGLEKIIETAWKWHKNHPKGY